MPYSSTQTVQARRIWLTATAVVGGTGLIATSVPFVRSLEPSERARALGAAVEVDVRGTGPGELLTVEWRGRPVWILRRTPAMLESLGRESGLLADPTSKRSEQPEAARNPWRSLRPELGVMVGICTHLGCVPTFRPTPGTPELGADWPGGFFCPCHGSRFDLAGRVFRNVPAPTNLDVPPYRFKVDGILVLGEAA